MKVYRGIGLMSGTSLDGIDLAYCEFARMGVDDWQHKILRATTIPYSELWRQRLATLQNESAETYARTNVEYGHLLGKELKGFISEAQIAPDFVASHGHTIFHQPGVGFTAQVGDGETMSSHLDCPLVSNFRNKDVAMNGQGAPLVPFGEKYLLPDCRLFLNLGGFANLTADGQAWDSSPCNFALNWVVKKMIDANLEYDPDGTFARSGKADESLLTALGNLDYYQQPPPKSLGREWFEEAFLPVLTRDLKMAPKDLLRTVCHHIASQAGQAVAATGIRETTILVTGGGARNQFLMELLGEELRQQQIEIDQDRDLSLIDYKEALIFAFLGLQTLLGRPNILPAATGAKAAAVAGSIHLPNRRERLCIFD